MSIINLRSPRFFFYVTATTDIYTYVHTLSLHDALPIFKLTTKTVELVRRGLNQIRHTVGALLVEARLDASQMSPADWEDLRTLIEPEIKARHARLLWDVQPDLAIDLPAHLVRQLPLNLLLHAQNTEDRKSVV